MEEEKNIYYIAVTINDNPKIESGKAPIKEVAHADSVKIFAINIGQEAFINEKNILFTRSFERNGKLYAFAENKFEAAETLNNYCLKEVTKAKNETEKRNKMSIAVNDFAYKISCGEA